MRINIIILKHKSFLVKLNINVAFGFNKGKYLINLLFVI